MWNRLSFRPTLYPPDEILIVRHDMLRSGDALRLYGNGIVTYARESARTMTLETLVIPRFRVVWGQRECQLGLTFIGLGLAPTPRTRTKDIRTK